MSIRRVAAAPVVALALVLLLSSCTPATPVERDLVGSWRDQLDRTVLQLQAGGRCEAERLVTVQGPATGACSWRIERQHADDGAPVVTLDFSGVPDQHVSAVTFEVHDGRNTLSFTDPSNDITTSVHRAGR